jgi:hypothetical protein
VAAVAAEAAAGLPRTARRREGRRRTQPECVCVEVRVAAAAVVTVTVTPGGTPGRRKRRKRCSIPCSVLETENFELKRNEIIVRGPSDSEQTARAGSTRLVLSRVYQWMWRT